MELAPTTPNVSLRRLGAEHVVVDLVGGAFGDRDRRTRRERADRLHEAPLVNLVF